MAFTAQQVISTGISRGKSPEEIKKKLAATGNLSAGAIEELGALTSGGGLEGTMKKTTPLTSAQSTEISGGDVALTALNQLTNKFKTDTGEYSDIGGKVAGSKPISGIREFFGDTEIGALESSVKSSAQVVGGFLEGGKLTDADAQKYMEILPNVTDSAELRAEKVKDLQALIINRKKTILDTYEKSGFDVAAFKDSSEDILGRMSGEEKPKQISPVMEAILTKVAKNPEDPKYKNFVSKLKEGKIDLENGVLLRGYDELNDVEKYMADQGFDVKGYKPEPIQPTEEPEGEPEEESFFKDLGGDIMETGKGIFESGKEGLGTVKETFDRVMEGQDPISTGVQLTGALGKFLGASAGELVLGTGKAVLPEKAEKAIGEGASKAVKAVLDTDIGQKGLALAKKGGDEWDSFKDEYPTVAANLEGIAGIVEGVTTISGTGALKSVGGKALKGTAKAGLKTAGKVGGPLASGAGKVADTTKQATGGISGLTKEAISKTIGVQRNTIEQVLKSPQKFSRKNIADLDEFSTVNQVKRALDEGMEELSSTGKAYDQIKKIDKDVNIGESTIKDFLTDKGIKTEDGKITSDLASELQLSKADAKSLGDVLESLTGKETLKPNEVLNLRTKLSELSGFGEGKTKSSKLLAKQLRSKIDEVAKKEVPGLKELDEKFAPQKKAMDQFRKDFLNKDGTLKDGAMGKINNLTGANKEIILGRVKQLVPTIEEDLNVLKAIKDIKASGGIKVGNYIGGGTAGLGAGLATGNPLVGVATAMATSPQIVIPALRGYATAKNIAKQTIEKMVKKLSSGVSLDENEQEIFSKMLENMAEKMPKVGMSVESVVDEKGQYKDLM